MNKIIHIKSNDDANRYVEELFDVKIMDNDFADLMKAAYESSLTISPYKWVSLLLSLLDDEVTIVEEDFHVDRAYRDSYYMYFSSKHFYTSRYCRRISLFKGIIDLEMFLNPEECVNEESVTNYHILQDSYIGCFTVKPIKAGSIGRTLLDPQKFKNPNKCYIRTTQYKTSILGLIFNICAFPYSMQDLETTRCAQITMLNIMDYYSTRYADYRYILPSDIIKEEQLLGFERALPSRGANYYTLTKVMTNYGFYPRLYNSKAMEDKKYFKRILHYYVESGIPVAIGLTDKMNLNANGHSIICIGHGMNKSTNYVNSIDKKIYKEFNYAIVNTADFFDEYVVIDDNQLPYCIREFDKMSVHDNLIPTDLAVPLYKRMFLEAMDAYDIACRVIVDEKLGLKKSMQNIDLEDLNNIGDKNNPIFLRLFMCSSKSFKNFKMHNTNKEHNNFKKIYSNIPFPRFIWVMEIYTKESYQKQKALGELVIDATANVSNGLESLVLLRYPTKISIRNPNTNIEQLIKFFMDNRLNNEEAKNCYYSGFNGNLKELTQ